MIVVTGAAGFIGSNIIKAFNDQGRYAILAVDDLTDGSKFRNLADCRVVDYMDKDEFISVVRMGAGLGGEVEAVFHQGACTDTTEWDGRYMMANNHEYSKSLLRYCLERQIPFIYASSAAVYGQGACFEEAPDCEAPLNVYGYSKLVFDEYVRSILPKARSQIVGLRYFNVYGPREQHKGRMASVAYHFNQQLLQDGRLRLFRGSDGYADGEQRRDFIYVGDVAAVNLWFLDRPEESGIYNVGTGRSQTFNELARAVIGYHGRGEIEYIPFPEHLRGRYQSFTEADIGELRAAGYGMQFRSLEEAVPEYLAWLNG